MHFRLVRGIVSANTHKNVSKNHGFADGHVLALTDNMTARLRHRQNVDVAHRVTGALPENALIDAELLPLPNHPHGRLVPAFVPAERLFSALDGRDLTIAGGRWRLEVYSVSDFQGHRWVQLALDGLKRCMVTVKLSPTDGVSRVLSGVTSWVRGPQRVAALEVT